jgi:hypothetical protein
MILGSMLDLKLTCFKVEMLFIIVVNWKSMPFALEGL